MNTTQTWQTIIETIIAVATIVAIFNEEKIVDWEQKTFKKIFKGGKH